MGCSFSLVLGMGGFDVLDLDTPLLLSNDPIVGGYRYSGPAITPGRESGPCDAGVVPDRRHHHSMATDHQSPRSDNRLQVS